MLTRQANSCPSAAVALRALVVIAAALAASCSGSDVNRDLGARCDMQSECNSRCLQPPAFPGGLCTLPCDGDVDCPADATCVDDEGGVCLFGCSGDPDCEFLGAGWVCQTRAGPGPNGPVDRTVCVGS